MPDVKPGENEKDFLARCIPIVIREGATKEQAAGKCYGIYRNAKKDINNKIVKVSKGLLNVCKSIGMLATDDIALKQGTQIELEHQDTYNMLVDYLKQNGQLPPIEKMAESIAKDHMAETPDYYSRLQKAGL